MQVGRSPSSAEVTSAGLRDRGFDYFLLFSFPEYVLRITSIQCELDQSCGIENLEDLIYREEIERI